MLSLLSSVLFVFFFNDTATTEIYTLSLHDALPSAPSPRRSSRGRSDPPRRGARDRSDRKSTRLNSSHQIMSYAVFCLKKKKTTLPTHETQKNTQRQHKTQCKNNKQ